MKQTGNHTKNGLTVKSNMTKPCYDKTADTNVDFGKNCECGVSAFFSTKKYRQVPVCDSCGRKRPELKGYPKDDHR